MPSEEEEDPVGLDDWAVSDSEDERNLAGVDYPQWLAELQCPTLADAAGVPESPEQAHLRQQAEDLLHKHVLQAAIKWAESTSSTGMQRTIARTLKQYDALPEVSTLERLVGVKRKAAVISQISRIF